MWTTYEVQPRCMFTLMKSVRVLYMWAPLGRKKQLPGLTSLKKNSSWSCKKTRKHDIYDWGFFLFTGLVFPLLPFRCVCDLSSLPPPAPSPIPACPSLLERPHLGDASHARVPSHWPGWLMTTGMFQIWSGGGERERIMSQQQTGMVRVSQKRGCYSTSDGWPCVYKAREQETGLWQTQHPAAADISSLAAMESHSAQ